MADAQDRLEAAAAFMSKEVMEELVKRVPGFDRAGMLTTLIAVWGGMDAFVRDFYLEFQRASPGSATRQKQIALVCMLISQQTDRQIKTNVGELSDDEVEDAILTMAPMLNKGKGA